MSKRYDVLKVIGDSYLHHSSEYDRTMNRSVDRVAFAKTPKEKEFAKMLAQGDMVLATIHKRLAQQYADRLGL